MLVLLKPITPTNLGRCNHTSCIPLLLLLIYYYCYTTVDAILLLWI